LIRTSAPLIIPIAGDWAGFDSQSISIVAAMSARVYCELGSSSGNEIILSLKDAGLDAVSARYLNHELVFDQSFSELKSPHLKIIKFTIESAFFLLNQFKPFKLNIWSETFTSHLPSKKIPFDPGYSAAIIVAVHGAILTLFGIHPLERKEREKFLKLCLITHHLVQDLKISGSYIAAAFYGGILQYTQFNFNWVHEKIQNNIPIGHLLNYKWPHLEIKPLPQLPNLHLLLGRFQKFASPSPLLSEINQVKINDPLGYNEISSQISTVVKDLSKAWKKKDLQRILADIKINAMYIRRLGAISGLPIESPELKLLSHIADEQSGAGKLSGLGDFDSGIALCFKKEISERILDEWAKYEIMGTEIAIDYDGLRIETMDD